MIEVITRPTYQTRTIRLVGIAQRELLKALAQNIPIDPAQPIEVVIREENKIRKADANALMWAGPLRDIAEQAWCDGRQYSAEVWHEHCKREYLPNELHPDFDRSHVKDGYQKWGITPFGDRVLLGSTTQLTVRGMSEYLDMVHALGASLGVQFSVLQRACADYRIGFYK